MTVLTKGACETHLVKAVQLFCVDETYKYKTTFLWLVIPSLSHLRTQRTMLVGAEHYPRQ